MTNVNQNPDSSKFIESVESLKKKLAIAVEARKADLKFPVFVKWCGGIVKCTGFSSYVFIEEDCGISFRTRTYKTGIITSPLDGYLAGTNAEASEEEFVELMFKAAYHFEAAEKGITHE